MRDLRRYTMKKRRITGDFLGVITRILNNYKKV